MEKSYTKDEMKQFGDARRIAKKNRQKYHKQVEALDRNAARKKLSPQQQLERLDWRLGKGVGANKERNRLAKQMESKEETKKDTKKGGKK